MGCEGNNCYFEDLVEDTRSGCFVCVKCGLVQGIIYERTPTCPDFEYNDDLLVEMKDILDRMHFPTSYASFCHSYYRKHYKGRNLKAIIFSIYKTLNEHSFNISLKDLLNANGLNGESTFKTQGTNENVLLDIGEMAEKYCNALNLSFKESSVIKEIVRCQPVSGHTPLTIIAGSIYLYCKEQKKKISVKKVAEITQVSCISIQRYIKFKNGHAPTQG